MNRLLSVVSILFLALSLVFILFPSSIIAADTGLGPYYIAGVYAFEEQDYQKAEVFFLKALQNNSNNSYCHHYLGKLYLETEVYHKAEKHLHAAWQVIPESFDLKYDLALLMFKLSDHEAAAALFKEIAAEDPADNSRATIALASYYAGMSFYFLGNYLKAACYLLAAAEQNTSIKENSFYYAGICYRKAGKPVPAMEKFDYLIKNARSSSLQINAQKQALLIKNRQKALKALAVVIKTGLGYDDNLRLEPCDQEIYSGKADIFYDAALSFDYSFVNQNLLDLTAGFVHYQSWHNRFKDYDISGSSLHLAFLNFFDSFAAGVKYIPSCFRAGNDRFLIRHTILPFATVRIDDTVFMRFSYDYSSSDYYQVSGRDGHSHEFSAELFSTIFTFNKKTDLSAKLGYEDCHSAASVYSYDKIKTRLRGAFQLPLSIDLLTKLKFELKQHNKRDNYFNKKREEKFYYFDIAFSRHFFRKWLTLKIQSGYQLNNSTINAFQYQKTITGFFIEADF